MAARRYLSEAGLWASIHRPRSGLPAIAPQSHDFLRTCALSSISAGDEILGLDLPRGVTFRMVASIELGPADFMMPLRLRTCLSVTLALVLVWTSGLQSARAWVDGSSTRPATIHSQTAVMPAGMHGAHGPDKRVEHDGHGGHSEHVGLHTETAKVDLDQPSCLMVCLDAYPDHYITAQLTQTAAPEPVALYPFPLDQIADSATCHILASLCRSARGPPRRPDHLAGNSFRKRLLLQTARFRI